jgi:hypothetical protein
MKRTLLVFSFAFLIVTTQAQVTDTAVIIAADTVSSPPFDRDDYSRDRLIFNVHWDGWLNADDSMGVKGLSSGVGLHFYYDIPLGGDNFSFAIGAGFSWSNYYNDSYFIYDTITLVKPFPDSIGVNKNKFVISYVEVPVEFRFRTNENKNGKRFKLAAGFKGGYVISDHVKYVGEDWRNMTADPDDEIKYKEYRIPFVNRLHYGPTFRIGYDKVNLEAYYGLSTIFEEGKGPSGTPITIGISINPF